MSIIKRWQSFKIPSWQQRKILDNQLPNDQKLNNISSSIPKNNYYQLFPKRNQIKSKKLYSSPCTYYFKSKLSRFGQYHSKTKHSVQSQGYYSTIQDKNKININNKKYSKKYINPFKKYITKPKQKIPIIPNYQVQYNCTKQNNLKLIKNSLRRYKSLINDSNEQNEKKKNKKNNTLLSTHNIINIKYRTKLVQELRQNHYQSIKKYSNPDHSNTIQQRTIDLPNQSIYFKSTKRELEQQQKMLFHRLTLYNRNMLGMLLAKLNNNKKGYKTCQKTCNLVSRTKKKFFKFHTENLGSK